MEKNYAIQFLRAIAAGLVVFIHSYHTYNSKISDIDLTVIQSLNLGNFGVEIFFVISGYIIYKTTINLKPSHQSSIKFLLKRIIRIAPIYWIATLIYTTKLTVQGNAPSVEHIFYSFIFYPFVGEHDLMRPVLGVGWTLNYEMFFYFVLTIAILLRTHIRFYFIFFIILIFYATLPNKPLSNGFHLLSTSFLFFFLIGVFVAHFEKLLKLFSFSKIHHLYFIPSIVAFYILFRALTNLNDLTYLIVDIFCAGSIVALAVIEKPTKTNSNQIREKINLLITRAGDASYSTYLFHGFIMGVLARAISNIDIYISPFLFALLMVFTATIAGYIIHIWIEMPVIKYLNQKVNVKSSLK